jgi:predicted CXXCH cytochrome family protein
MPVPTCDLTFAHTTAVTVEFGREQRILCPFPTAFNKAQVGSGGCGTRRALWLPFVVLVAVVGLRALEHPVTLETNFDAAKCLECHEEKAKNKAVHSAMAMGCTACHEVTTERDTPTIKLTAPTVAELCFQCHGDKNPAGAKGVVHRPAVSNCTACHSPHSSPNKNQLLKPASGSQSENLCLACHDKGLKAPEKGSRHVALDGGCDTCHQTHKVGDPDKTEFAFHWSKAVPALCLECHDAKDKALTMAHRDQPFAQVDCTTCHDAHQSFSPKLMNANLHPPFADKVCEMCHQPAKDGKVVVNESGKRTLCYTCHDEKQKQVVQSKTQHAVFAVTHWQDDLLFVLKQEQDGYEFCQQQMAECDRQLHQFLQIAF